MSACHRARTHAFSTSRRRRARAWPSGIEPAQAKSAGTDIRYPRPADSRRQLIAGGAAGKDAILETVERRLSGVSVVRSVGGSKAGLAWRHLRDSGVADAFESFRFEFLEAHSN